MGGGSRLVLVAGRWRWTLALGALVALALWALDARFRDTARLDRDSPAALGRRLD